MTKTSRLLASGLLASGIAAVAPQAYAQTPAPAAAPAPVPAPAAAPAAPASWNSTITLGAQFEGGVSFAPAGPKTNFGQLFTDHANQATLNQVLLTAQRQIDPKATGWDVGFKLQVMYGSDARYTHFLGELDTTLKDRYQLDIVEANVVVHMPILTDGGLDLKVGQYSTPLGFETIDPSGNAFYTHSYIFNFGLPLKHTGGLAILHATPILDIYGGVDSGVNTSLGDGDNNGSPSGIVGFGLNNLADGNLTVLALSHFGPEQPSALVPNAGKYMRYINDIYLTYKVNDKLSLTTEFNLIRDDFLKATGGGAAQYVSYALSDTITLNGRAEVWADGNDAYVFSFPGNLDAVNSQLGRPNGSFGAKATTYGELTLGFTWKPAVPAPISSLMIRPEIRYDQSLNNTHPFNSGKDSGAFTIASDFVLAF